MAKKPKCQSKCQRRPDAPRFGCTHHPLNGLHYRWGVADVLKQLTGKATGDEFAPGFDAEFQELLNMVAGVCRNRFPCLRDIPCFEATLFDVKMIGLLDDI